MTREQTLLALCLLLLAAALATLLGMLRFRRQYFRLYREVQLCQRALLADQPLPEAPVRRARRPRSGMILPAL